MSESYVVPFSWWHPAALMGRDAVERARSAGRFLTWGELRLVARYWWAFLGKRPRGPAFTMRVGSRLMVSAAVEVIRPGVGEMWIFASEAFDHYQRPFWRFMGECVEMAFSLHDLRRVHLKLNAEDASQARFLEDLGFLLEGTFRGIGDQGETHLVYAKVVG